MATQRSRGLRGEVVVGLRRYAANAVTLLGLGLGLAALALWPAPWAALLLLASLGCDACDGAIARRLGSTELGRRLDWYTDVGLAYGIAWRFLPPIPAAIYSALLLSVQVQDGAARLPLEQRISGRAGMTAVAMVVFLLQWGRGR